MEGITLRDAILYAIDKWQFVGMVAIVHVLLFLIIYPMITAAVRLKRERDAEARKTRLRDRWNR